MQIRLGRAEIEEAVKQWTLHRILGQYEITEIKVGQGGMHITVEVEPTKAEPPDTDDESK